jgi:NTP pyrophosphatase (non-canonical NTP hydrolase)
MNKLQELMAISAEECGELTQACIKIIRKFNNIEDVTGDRRDKLIEEAGDVACMLELMVENGLFTEEEIRSRIETKRDKLKKWSQLFNENPNT